MENDRIDRDPGPHMTGKYLTQCIRSGANFVHPEISTLTQQQQDAIRNGSAKLVGDTIDGLHVVYK